MSETRRHALKILGTVTATCAFPFASEELYGQHVMFVPGQTPAAGPYKPSFFTADEHAVLSRLTDVIIPETDTPGASRAGVPEYIDRVVTANKEHQPLARAGLAWLIAEARSPFSRDYLSLDESQHAALLQPLERCRGPGGAGAATDPLPERAWRPDLLRRRDRRRAAGPAGRGCS